MTPDVSEILWSGWEDLTQIWEAWALLVGDPVAADADAAAARVIIELSDDRWIEVGLYEGWPEQRLVRPLRGVDLVDHLRGSSAQRGRSDGPAAWYRTTDEGLRAYADATGWQIGS